MQKLLDLKNMFLLNALLEMGGGVVLLLYPRMILIGANHTTESLAVGKMYGLAAFIIGVISYQCFRNYEKDNRMFSMIFLAFTGFHLLISFQMFGSYNHSIINHPGPFVLHLLLAVWFTIAFLVQKE